VDTKRAKAYYDEMNSLIRKVSADKKLTFTEMKDYIDRTIAGRSWTSLRTARRSTGRSSRRTGARATWWTGSRRVTERARG